VSVCCIGYLVVAVATVADDLDDARDGEGSRDLDFVSAESVMTVLTPLKNELEESVTSAKIFLTSRLDMLLNYC